MALAININQSLPVILLVGMLGACPAVADEDHAPMARAIVAETLYSDLHRDIVVAAIVEQNERQIEKSAAAILKIEQQWSQEKREGGGALLASVDQSTVSTYLRTLKAEAEGLYTEILLMDKHGFLVGQSDLVEYDASVQAIQSQVSFTIVDPETDEPIGAATVGLNGNML